jgi:hypothetical protein
MPSSQRALPRRLELILVALAVGSTTAVASADEPPLADAPAQASPRAGRVLLLVRTPGDERVMELVLAELEPHDWRVVELRPDARDAPAPLGEIAARQAATAVLRFSRELGAIELWVAGAAGASEETIATPGEVTSDQVLALRATEALRARGLDFGLRPRVEEPARAEKSAPPPEPLPRPAPVPPDEPSEPAAPPARGLSLELGPGVSASPGGMGALLLFGAAARADLSEELALSAAAWLPLTSARVRGAEGSADWASSFFGGSLDVSLASAGPLAVRAAGGALVTVTRMTGAPATGFDGRSDSVVTAVPFLRTTLRAALGDRFGVWLAGYAGLSFPEVRMSFGEREAARFGRPLLLASIGVDARLVSFEKSEPD